MGVNNIIKYHWKFLSLLIILLSITNGFGCKYTVRDIGFTDLGRVEYSLYFFADRQTPADMVSSFEKLAYAAFLDANVKARVINIEEQKDHPAAKYLKELNINSFPAVILVSPDGDALNLNFSGMDKNFNEKLWHLIESTVSSPMRKKITAVIKDNYGAVLFVEGKDKEKNKQAKRVIKAAVKDIAQIMELMPKPIENPPQVIDFFKNDFAKETVLIWSLKLDAQFNEPQLVVLFGRGRRIGQVLKGAEITKENLFSMLAIVGADCECGLDRSIMLGKMIPLRWDKEIQAQMARQLEFDVENPMIKSEMSQILSIAPAQKGKNTQNPLSVYKEGIVKFDSIPTTPTVSSNTFRAPGGFGKDVQEHSIFHIVLYSVAGIFLIVLFAGYFIFRRNRNKRL